MPLKSKKWELHKIKGIIVAVFLLEEMMKRNILMIMAGMVIMLLNSSCSTSVKFAYNQADWLILKQISDFACLEKKQKNTLEGEIKGFMLWHRKEELPVYAATINEFAGSLEKGSVTKESFDKMNVFFELTQKKTTDKIKNFGIDFVMNLSTEQISCSLEKFEKSASERKKELEMDRDKYMKKQKKEMIKQAKSFLGSVTDEQIAMIDTVLAPQEEEKIASEASDRKKEYMKTVLLMPNTPEKRTKIVELIENPYAFYNEKEIELMKKRRERSKEGFWKLSQTLTEKQRIYLAKELRKYSKAFSELSQEK
jgi:hypothetical protein